MTVELCRDCGNPIKPGDSVDRYASGVVLHLGCAISASNARSNEYWQRVGGRDVVHHDGPSELLHSQAQARRLK